MPLAQEKRNIASEEAIENDYRKHDKALRKKEQ